MGRKKNQNQNLLINDLEIDEHLLTDDENQPAKASLRSRAGKKKKKQSANKVMNDANLINISDFETASSTLSDSDELAEPPDRGEPPSDRRPAATDSNEFNLLGEFLNREPANDSDLTDDFRRNLDLNLKKKKRIFLSSDRTDFLNFILSEQQKIKKNSSFSSFLNSSSKCNTNTFKLNSLAGSPANRREAERAASLHSDHQAYSDDEDANSEFNLLPTNERASSDTAGELADDEDDGLNYLDYFNHNSTKRRFRRLFGYLFGLFGFDRAPSRPNNLNSYLLNRLDQRPYTAASADSGRPRPNDELRPSDHLTDDDELDDLDFETSFSARNSPSLLAKLRDSVSNLTHYLNLSNKRQSNKINYFYKNNHKLSPAECVDLLGASATVSTKNDELFGEDGWFDHHGKLKQSNQINVRLLKSKSHVQPESMFFIMVQVFIPFLIAGFGTVGAGLVLDLVQHWKVFEVISEIFILVPALLGLKGNLEMTLASRLSTQANLGNLDTFASQFYMATGNMALIQCQATVVGFLAALFAIAVNWLPNAEFNLHHALLLCASSLLTASIASFILGVIMILVVIISHKCNINPDNVATPIAASLGDLITLMLLANISNFLYYKIDNSIWICTLCIVTMLALIPAWSWIANRNRYTKQVLYSGWTPVVSAMAISSFGGCILDFAVSRFRGIAVFQPVINGVGGNLIAVQASRLSTYLHQRYRLGDLDKKEREFSWSPMKTFFANTVHAKTAKVLLLLVVPGHLIFIQGIKLLQAGHTSITLIFLYFYLLAALIQVFVLLYIAQIIIFWMWRKGINPDDAAIPYLTALGDLIGTSLLSLAFYLLFLIGDRDEDVGE